MAETITTGRLALFCTDLLVSNLPSFNTKHGSANFSIVYGIGVWRRARALFVFLYV